MIPSYVYFKDINIIVYKLYTNRIRNGVKWKCSRTFNAIKGMAKT